VAGVEIAAAIRQPSEEPIFRLSMRSSVDFDVSAVCAVFGGGGHTRAAGATLSGFADISAALADMRVPIMQINTQKTPSGTMSLVLKIACKNTSHYNSIMSRLKSIKDVIDVVRGYS
jgi:hypothetical protein